jgi:hypothetical protein
MPLTRPALARIRDLWLMRRAETQRRVEALRQRDGDNCRRCRRPLRFDLPSGHDQAPRLEPIAPHGNPARRIDDWCLCHARCNAETRDNTLEVLERRKLREQAATPTRKARKARKPGRKAA